MADEFDEIGIDLHLAVLVKRAAKIERAFDLAAPERGARLLPKNLFLRPQILRQFELHVEVTVVDRTDLPRESANRGFG